MVAIVDQYGEVVCKLEKINDDEYIIPDGDDPWPCFFCVGDTYTVKEI